MAVNKVILVGNVGKDPETRYLDENTPVCKFPLATSEVYKNRDGEKIEQTEWHNIVLWRGLAKIAEQYVKKGAQLFIEGRIRNRSYDDKDGIKRYITEIVGDNMQMLGRRQDNDQQQDSNSNSYQQESGSYQQAGGSSRQQSSSQSPGNMQGSGPQGSGPQNSDQQQSRPQSPGNQQPQSSSSAGGANPDIDGPGNESDDLPF